MARKKRNRRSGTGTGGSRAGGAGGGQRGGAGGGDSGWKDDLGGPAGLGAGLHGPWAWGASLTPEAEGLPTIVGPDPLLPSATEAVMADISAMLAGREFRSIDEANAFLREATTAGPLPSAFPSTPLARAQQLVYRAMDAGGKERVALARKALGFSKDCADAYIILATETAQDQHEEVKLFQQALEAAERALEGTGYEEHLPHLWGHVPGRPLLRALFGLGLSEWVRGARLAAVGHLRRILSLSEEDTQGARYYLLGWLLDIDDLVLSRELVAKYRETTAVWLWGDALLTFKEKGPSGARAKLRKAHRANPLVPELLIGEDDEEPAPHDRLEVEAHHAVIHLGRAWIRDIPAMWWLEEETASLPAPRRPPASRQRRSGSARGLESDPLPDSLRHSPAGDPSGLDGDALMRLLAIPLGVPGCAVVPRDDLSLSELAGSAYLFNARLFLEKAASADVRATAKGNLNQAFVEYMANGMRLSAVEEHWFSFGRPKREDGFTALRALRAVLTLAGLLEAKPRSFAVTEEGFRLLAEGAAGELQALLFRTFFGPFDLSFLDAAGEDFLLQATVPYTLFMMSREAGEWLSPGDLRDHVLAEVVRDPEEEASILDEPLWRFESRIVAPLVGFGLLERRPHPDPPDDTARLDSTLYRYQVRRTPLFDRFIEFDLA